MSRGSRSAKQLLRVHAKKIFPVASTVETQPAEEISALGKKASQLKWYEILLSCASLCPPSGSARI